MNTAYCAGHGGRNSSHRSYRPSHIEDGCQHAAFINVSCMHTLITSVLHKIIPHHNSSSIIVRSFSVPCLDRETTKPLPLPPLILLDGNKISWGRGLYTLSVVYSIDVTWHFRLVTQKGSSIVFTKGLSQHENIGKYCEF